MKKIINAPLLFIVLSFLYPASYLLEINSHVYTRDQIIVTFIFVFLVSVITALIAGISINYFVKIYVLAAKKFGFKADINSIPTKLYRSFLSGLGTIILLILLFITIQTSVSDNLLFTLLCLLLTLGLPVLTYRHNILKHLNFILCAMIMFNCSLGLYHRLLEESLKHDKQKKEHEVAFKHKPNVYLVILESYASLDIRKEVYGIDNALLKQNLIRNNYTIYKTYASYNSTLPSLASIFLMGHHYYTLSRGLADGGGYRKIIGGVENNQVMNIFLKNGYRIDYSKFPSSLYHPSVVINAERQPLLQPLEVFSGIFAISYKLLNQPLWSSTFFQSLIRLPEKILGESFEHSIIATSENDGRPLFSFIYFGDVPHTNSFFSQYPPEIRNMPSASQMALWQLNHLNDYWITTYKNSVAKSDLALTELVNDLDKKDPHAIVILVGDHGPNFNRDRWVGQDNNPNGNMIKNGIQPVEMTRDIFEVMMAIKWPHHIKNPQDYFSHVNLFRHVFAVLAKDDSILKTEVADDSYMRSTYLHTRTKGIYRTVNDGKPLVLWEPFMVPSNIMK